VDTSQQRVQLFLFCVRVIGTRVWVGHDKVYECGLPGAAVLNNERSIESQIKAAEKELASLNKRKTQLENEIKQVNSEC
jgi:septal ring factor EnvC (AmiA/AmiB activator)